MDDLIEFILELVFDVGIEVAQDKKAPRLLRYFFTVLILVSFLLVILLLFWISLMALEENILISLFFFIIDIVIVVSGIKKIKSVYLKLQDNKTKASEK